MSAPNRTMFAILGFLTHAPMSGYDIKKYVEQSVDNFWNESFGQIYPILRHLNAEGLVTKTTAGGSGKRPRHVYAITDKGRDALIEWLHEPTEPPALRNELLLKLFFGGEVEKATSRGQIDAYRRRMTMDLERYRTIEKKLRAEHGSDPNLPYWLMTLRYGQRDREALIAWCDEAIALLDSIPETASEPPADTRIEARAKGGRIK